MDRYVVSSYAMLNFSVVFRFFIDNLDNILYRYIGTLIDGPKRYNQTQFKNVTCEKYFIKW